MSSDLSGLPATAAPPPADHPLLAAVRTGDPHEVRRALRDPWDRSTLSAALYAAARAGHVQLLVPLAEHATDGYFEARAAALILAARTGEVAAVHALIRPGDAPGTLFSAFLYAAQCGQAEVVRAMSPAMTASHRGKALLVAATGGAPATLLPVLFELSVDPEKTKEALAAAIVHRRDDWVTALLDRCSIPERIGVLQEAAYCIEHAKGYLEDQQLIDRVLAPHVHARNLGFMLPRWLKHLPAARARGRGNVGPSTAADVPLFAAPHPPRAAPVAPSLRALQA